MILSLKVSNMQINSELQQELQLMEFLLTCRGKGTSLVSLVMRAGSQPGDASRKITSELSAASNIKDRVNRLSVKSALRSVLSHIKSMKSFGDNGVAIFSGQCV